MICLTVSEELFLSDLLAYCLTEKVQFLLIFKVKDTELFIGFSSFFDQQAILLVSWS